MPNGRLVRTLALATLGVLLVGAPPSFSAPSRVLIRNATLISRADEPPRTGMDLLVENEIIRRIGQRLSEPDARVIDATGKTVLPGLIDCHTHLLSVPGALLRDDSPERLEEARRVQLRSYVAAGVTTVLDAAATPTVLTEMRRYTEETRLGPRIEGLAPMLTPEGGYFADERLRADQYPDLWPPIGEDLGRIEELLQAAEPLHPVGVKVTVEDGYGPFPVWPLFDDEALATIRERAAAHRTPIFVHAIGADEYARALTLKPAAFVHGGFMESAPDPDLLRAVQESGATVITTLAIADMLLLTLETERLDDPWMRLLVPEDQLATAADPAKTEAMRAAIAEQNTPSWVPRFLVRWLAPWFYSESSVRSLRDSAMAAVKAMHDAGIPLVMGSDMGNWPVFTSLFHGVGSIREMELLEQAGLPRQEVLAAATSRAAALLRRAHEIGTLEVGKKADLVIANQNPLEAGMSALRDLAYVMKDGELRTPQAWMTEPAHAEAESAP